MGMLIEGKWVKGSIIKSDNKGAYDRLPRTFRGHISEENSNFKPESGRYHLYVSYACPWAQRTLIYRKLKELEDHISFSVVHPDMLDEGWVFDDSYLQATKDDLFDSKFLSEIYTKADPKITTSVTVPILWDKKLNTIVNNESSEIIRMFNTSFNSLTGNKEDFYPEKYREKIDGLNDKIYHDVNNGVYKCGFSKTQKAYDDASRKLFQTLDFLDGILGENKFLIGEELTEADLRLIPTLLRFDIVYVTHFKCNLRQIKDYKNLGRYTKELYEMPAIKETTNLDHIKRHYYFSHEDINPHRIIPSGPSCLF
ncbi:MAG: glutathione-dependent reductase [Halobacteriovoraceae bacterium]|nr:glutathione-dependent reductase [Halobacteriovoraceae bacterium]|tara:strand:- start:1536 stop:2468 length:933 start_codon:yes stop_codon:yes gene_type:complete